MEPASPDTPSVNSQPELATPTVPTPPVQPTAQPKKRFSLGNKKLPLIIAAAVLLLGGAYAYFGIYQQSPSVVWGQAMSRTGEGLEKFIEKSRNIQKKGVKAKGTFRMEQPAVSDGSFDLKSDEKNAILKADVGFAGSRFNAEARLITPEGAESPDIYANVTGLKAVAGFIGASDAEMAALLSSVDGQWYVLDHTFLDQMVASSGASDSSANLTPEDIRDIETKLTAVVNDYIFTDDESKAVITQGKFIGREDFEGTPSFRYEAEIHKDKLRDFVVALKDAAKATKLNELFATSGQSFEQALGLESILKGIDEADLSKVKTEVWVAKRTKLIRNIRFTPTDLKDGETGYFDLGLDYAGGDEMTFKVAVVGDDSQVGGSVILSLKVNQETLVSNFLLEGNFDYKEENSLDAKFRFAADIELTDETVDVEKPEGARNVMELFSGLLQSFLPSPELEGFDQSSLELDEL